MKRLLVNDMLSAMPGHRTFWNDLQDWFDMEFVGGDFNALVRIADERALSITPSEMTANGIEVEDSPSLIVRNASWFGPLEASRDIPTISLLQDIFEDGPLRKMQEEVGWTSKSVVFNSNFTHHQYKSSWSKITGPTIIPLPVDFALFEPGNSMGLQQSLSLPDGCICWVGASQDAAGRIKGYDVFLTVARQNPDLNFVAVFKDAEPEYCPPNMRTMSHLSQDELAKVMAACRVGLCTSRMESQHLAGIEMGACGLPMVAPSVGVYWERKDMPGVVISDPNPESYASAVRAVLSSPGDPQQTSEYWRHEFDRPVIRAAWQKLIEEVECSGQS